MRTRKKGTNAMLLDDASAGSQSHAPVGRRSAAIHAMFLVGAVTVLLVACVLAAQDRRRLGFWIGGPFIVGVTSFFVGRLRGVRVGDWAGLGVSVGILLGVLGLLTLGTARRELPRVGDGIVREVEDYRRIHDRYPDSLDGAGVRPAWNRFGGWSYEARDGGRGWDISVGDYSADGFEMYRSSDHPDWVWDG